MKSVAISVIVPIYNVESYVLGCLTSIQNQTFRDFEVICIDDGSTDNSAQIAADFCTKDNRFSLIRQENKGLSGARNTGLDAAQGQYIYFIDSDDYLHPQALEIMYDVIQEQKTDVVNIQLIKTKEHYPVDFTVFKKPYPKIQEIDNPFGAFVSRREIATGVCTRLYKKIILDDIRFIEGIYFEDIPFTIQVMARISKMSYIPLPLYYYYTNPNSIMRSSFTEEKVRSYFRVIQEIYNYIQKNHPDYLPLVRRKVLNKRVKMMMNQAVRKQKDSEKQYQLFQGMQNQLSNFYVSGIISYKGLKLYHKIALFLLLHNCPKAACRWMRLF